MTEEEIFHGLKKDTMRNEHCLCFIRDIRNINLKHPKSWRFIEQNDDGSVNEEPMERLSHLCQSLEDILPHENIFR